MSVFWRNGGIMVQVWKDQTCANEKYEPCCSSCKQREKDRKTNMEIKKPYAVGQYGRFI
jgi:hypothetical protein